MKTINELIDEVLDAGERHSNPIFVSGSRTTGEPLAEALRKAVEQRDHLCARLGRSNESDDAEIRSILEKASKS